MTIRKEWTYGMGDLSVYRAKRDFARSREPKGARQAAVDGTFVVQKHAASSLHYDFRLGIGSVLVSWAVAKGPSLNPTDKRLAVRTEDHPADYADFEGTIPEGEYGAGTVMLWDRGSFTPEGDPAAGLERGKLSFTLSGQRLKGGFALVRMDRKDDRENWLLIKERDDQARDRGSLGSAQDRSVESGRTLRQIGDKTATKRKRRGKERNGRVSRKRSSDENTEIAGIRLTHPDRPLYPDMGVTKRSLATYYAAIAAVMLPTLRDRPISLVRCPEGRRKNCFFQKHAGSGLPEAIERFPVKEVKGATRDYLLVNTTAALVTCAQVGALELHLWGSRRDRLERPDRLVFDLDPGEGVGFADVRQAAFDLRDRLAGAGLAAWPLLTGGKGIHLVLTLERRYAWEDVGDFARKFAESQAADEPDRFVASLPKARRKGRILIDHFRNHRGATAIAPFSPRARKGAPVAVPVSWKELRAIEASNAFSLSDPVKKLKARARAWPEKSERRQRLTKAARRHLGI